MSHLILKLILFISTESVNWRRFAVCNAYTNRLHCKLAVVKLCIESALGKQLFMIALL